MSSEPASDSLDKEAKKKQLKKEQKERERAEKLEKFEQKKAREEAEKKAKAESGQSNQKESQQKEKKSATYDIPTPVGDKKDVLCELPEAYSPAYVEAAWNDWWTKQGYFKPEFRSPLVSKSDERYVCAFPPPNVTGFLHIGHALTIAIEDSIARWHRMLGHEVLWNPGCDHAGIATQVVVEKKVAREQKKTRHELGRDKFLEEVWKWKREKGDRIYQQMQVVGTGCDWSRARFTMDPMLSRAVTEAFVRLHDENIIYRANRLVNWSCTLRSAISDIEVEKQEVNGRTMLRVPGYTKPIEVGVIASFEYPLADGSGSLMVCTTRLETMLGDTAVAVHPDDERYKHLIGKQVRHPFARDGQSDLLTIIGDESIDRLFGTGVMKVTPAHDPADFELGHKHKLQFLSIFDDRGYVLPGFGQFSGMKRFDARKKVKEELEKLGLFKEIQNHNLVIPVCSRSKDIIEPMLKPQWYVNCKTMAAQAVEAVRSGALHIVPVVYERTWYSWLENCRDWCISRQLWWGHRIPVYFVTLTPDPARPDEPVPKAANVEEEQKFWVSGRSEAEARSKAAARFGVPVERVSLRRDEDVLDTWFSSGLFPFSIFGWPDGAQGIEREWEKDPASAPKEQLEGLEAARRCWSDLARYYPTSVLETAPDILFFWVARMVMMGMTLLDKLPFHTVLLHPVLRDRFGEKISKSKGNVIDPMDVVRGISLAELNLKLDKDTNLDLPEVTKAKEGQRLSFPRGIPECGADALRFALAALTSPLSASTGGAYSSNVDVDRIQGYRFFANKIWNATRFLLHHALPADYRPRSKIEFTGVESELDRWIVSRLAVAVRTCESAWPLFDFPTITSAIYNFWLYELCDYYIEYAKPFVLTREVQGNSAAKTSPERAEAVRNILFHCLHTGLRLLAPFMPFVSEELFQRLLLISADTSEREKVARTAHSICVYPYPRADEYKGFVDENVERHVSLLQEAIRSVLSVKGDYQLTKRSKPNVTIYCSTPEANAMDEAGVLEGYVREGVFSNLAQCGNVTVERHIPPNAHATAAVKHLTTTCDIFVHMEGMIDVKKEIAKAKAEGEKIRKQLAKLDYERSLWTSSGDVATGEVEGVPVARRRALEEQEAQQKVELSKVEALLEALSQMDLGVS